MLSLISGLQSEVETCGARGRILGQNPDKKVPKRVFLLAIHSHLYSFAVRFSLPSNSRNLLQFLQFSHCIV
jgi:hypothetical protein